MFLENKTRSIGSNLDRMTDTAGQGQGRRHLAEAPEQVADLDDWKIRDLAVIHKLFVKEKKTKRLSAVYTLKASKLCSPNVQSGTTTEVIVTSHQPCLSVNLQTCHSRKTASGVKVLN